jgi:hypothetical protein
MLSEGPPAAVAAAPKPATPASPAAVKSPT